MRPPGAMDDMVMTAYYEADEPAENGSPRPPPASAATDASDGAPATPTTPTATTATASPLYPLWAVPYTALISAPAAWVQQRFAGGQPTTTTTTRADATAAASRAPRSLRAPTPSPPHSPNDDYIASSPPTMSSPSSPAAALLDSPIQEPAPAPVPVPLQSRSSAAAGPPGHTPPSPPSRALHRRSRTVPAPAPAMPAAAPSTSDADVLRPRAATSTGSSSSATAASSGDTSPATSSASAASDNGAPAPTPPTPPSKYVVVPHPPPPEVPLVAKTPKNAAFHRIFKHLPLDEFLIEDFSCALQKEILVQGRLYLTDRHICFHAVIFGWVTSLTIAFSDVTRIDKKSTALIFPNAIEVATAQQTYFFASFIFRELAFNMMTALWRKQCGPGITPPPLPDLVVTPASPTRANAPAAQKTDSATSSDENGVRARSLTQRLVTLGRRHPKSRTNSPSRNGTNGDKSSSRPASAPASTDTSPLLAPAAEVAEVPPLEWTTDGHEADDNAGDSDFDEDEDVDLSSALPAHFELPPVLEPHSDTASDDPCACAPLATTVLDVEWRHWPPRAAFAVLFGPHAYSTPRSHAGVPRHVLEHDLHCTSLSATAWTAGPPPRRSITYTMPLAVAMGPKQTTVQTTESLLAASRAHCAVNVHTVTPDVPYGAAFTVHARVCLDRTISGGTNVRVSVEVVWAGKPPWLRGPVEAGAVDGQKKYWARIAARMESLPPPSTAPATNGRAHRRRVRVGAHGPGLVVSTTTTATTRHRRMSRSPRPRSPVGTRHPRAPSPPPPAAQIVARALAPTSTSWSWTTWLAPSNVHVAVLLALVAVNAWVFVQLANLHAGLRALADAHAALGVAAQVVGAVVHP
ncbi:hypothetical protein GGF32_002562 [Allomyces javanicus]|nr:hypothetical protein GGF32_002562 [Allomyces javanicus]